MKLQKDNNVAVSVDPGFADPEAGDFRFSEDAEVFTLIPDFEALPIDKMGRQFPQAEPSSLGMN